MSRHDSTSSLLGIVLIPSLLGGGNCVHVIILLTGMTTSVYTLTVRGGGGGETVSISSSSLELITTLVQSLLLTTDFLGLLVITGNIMSICKKEIKINLHMGSAEHIHPLPQNYYFYH